MSLSISFANRVSFCMKNSRSVVRGSTFVHCVPFPCMESSSDGCLFVASFLPARGYLDLGTLICNQWFFVLPNEKEVPGDGCYLYFVAV